jgi:hypothetical protein
MCAGRIGDNRGRRRIVAVYDCESAPNFDRWSNGIILLISREKSPLPAGSRSAPGDERDLWSLADPEPHDAERHNIDDTAPLAHAEHLSGASLSSLIATAMNGVWPAWSFGYP